MIKSIFFEVESQKATCADWGITVEEIENTPESTATTAYGGYLLDVGIHGTCSWITRLLVGNTFSGSY